MQKKIILVGDGNVGKTALMNQFVHKKFSENYKPSIGSDFLTKRVDGYGEIGYLQIWDTAGQERFQSLSSYYYKDASLIIFVFDVTNQQSFYNIKDLIAIVNYYLEERDVPFVLVGNKVDSVDERMVSSAEAKAYARENGFESYIETSAKTNTNVEKLFNDAVSYLVDAEQESTSEEDVESEEQHNENKFLLRITSYAKTLSNLNTKVPSLNNREEGKTKGQQLEQIFKGDGPTQEQLEDILRGNQYPKLLDNRSRLPFKLYKVKSFLSGSRNQFIDNRLCESKSEEMMARFYQKTFEM